MTASDITLKMAIIVIVGVFAGSFMDAVAGGGGIITVPTYLLTGIPAHIALGTNKFSSSIGTMVSTGRYIAKGYADLKYAIPSAALAVIGAYFGTRLQLTIEEKYLQYVLVAVLPVIALVVLRQRSLPEVKREMNEATRMALVCVASGIIGMYDGFYGPGTGTFMILALCTLAKFDVRTASGNAKIVNLASNVGALATSLINGKVFFLLGLIGMVASLSGHYIGSGFAIKNGSKIVRPMVIIVLILLVIKIVVGFIK
ncbi:MAG: TSUP family transporter [Oscillospiraceae bacterium]|nr:TSUP family transporter [Oscillospiraceae bacterium]